MDVRFELKRVNKMMNESFALLGGVPSFVEG
jgi:hypothetical protein